MRGEDVRPRWKAWAIAGAILAALAIPTAHARGQIKVVGSSTVFPYAQAAAEAYAKKNRARAPVVESTGTGGGIKAFCGGVGAQHPDIATASRRMKKSEFDLCARNGTGSITEAFIGYDGLTLAHSRRTQGGVWNLSKGQIFLALASEVPLSDGRFAPNPYRTWNQIDRRLPAAPIRVFGPPPTSGTRDAFVELVMVVGCKSLAPMSAAAQRMPPADFDKLVKARCERMRQDGPFIEAGENDNIIVQRLQADPVALGVFGYSFLYENSDRMTPVLIDGVAPSEGTIASGAYKIARPLYIYIKNAHRRVIPGLDAFAREFVSTDSIGLGGYNEEHGLTPAEMALLRRTQAAVANATPMTSP